MPFIFIRGGSTVVVTGTFKLNSAKILFTIFAIRKLSSVTDNEKTGLLSIALLIFYLHSFCLSLKSSYYFQLFDLFIAKVEQF